MNYIRVIAICSFVKIKMKEMSFISDLRFDFLAEKHPCFWLKSNEGTSESQREREREKSGNRLLCGLKDNTASVVEQAGRKATRVKERSPSLVSLLLLHSARLKQSGSKEKKKKERKKNTQQQR